MLNKAEAFEPDILGQNYKVTRNNAVTTALFCVLNENISIRRKERFSSSPRENKAKRLNPSYRPYSKGCPS